MRLNTPGLALPLAVMVLLAVGIVGGAAQSALPTIDGFAPFDPYILTVIEAQGEAEFYVVLKAQADLSAAAELDTKEAKGRYVFDALNEVASRTQGPILQALAADGVPHQPFWIRNMVRVRGDQALLRRMAVRPDVAEITYEYEPVLDLEPQAPGQTEPNAVEWNIQRVHADDVWALGITGDGAVVAHLDTGADWEHPALVRSYRPQIPGAPTRHDYNWWDGPYGSWIPLDYGDHGTATLGTIVGDGGDANEIGMAPGADWIACAGLGPYATLTDCFQFFLAPTRLDGTMSRPDLAPHVINNSWSSDSDYHRIIEALYAAGIYFAKAAGNEGPDCKTVTNPGQWPEVTAVGAFDIEDNIASFSSRGPVTVEDDTVIKPDIAAPGVAIRSSLPGGAYGTKNGTSMACPHVTGAVALLISANGELAGQVDILQRLLKGTAERRIDVQCPPNDPRGAPNNVWGHGILNAYAAVDAVLSVGGIEGMVYDSTTSSPVPDAQLTFQGSYGWTRYGQSNAGGHYEQSLPVDTYVLTTTHYGYLPGVDTDLTIWEGVTTTHDIYLDPAPVWTVSGTVSEAQTGDPLAALVEFQETPITAETDPGTGFYSAEVADGTWWMKASSPGHAWEERLVTVDQDQIQDYRLPAIDNYYMRTSNDLCDPATFAWMDASGGDARCLGDDSYLSVPLPDGRTFTFYGNEYASLYLGSNGHVTFGTPWLKWSGPIPDPALPNNGIYAFSTDLNPDGCSQGTIYTDYLDERYFVIQFDEVEHQPAGQPETFETILDLDTGQVTIQFLTVSDPSEAVVGVENADGTEATQYAYADPELITDSVRVEFYPTFGTPPAMGPGVILGTVSDADTGALIEGATVTAVADTGGGSFTFTTNESGGYGGLLCPGSYTTWAEADGYQPSEEKQTEIMPAAATVQNFELVPIQGNMFVQFIYLGPIEPPTGGRFVLGLVRIIDENMTPVGGATVDVEWTIPNGYPIPQSRLTSPQGVAVPIMLGTWPGTYQLCVTDVTAAGYMYDPSMNLETCDWITLP